MEAGVVLDKESSDSAPSYSPNSESDLPEKDHVLLPIDEIAPCFLQYYWVKDAVDKGSCKVKADQHLKSFFSCVQNVGSNYELRYSHDCAHEDQVKLSLADDFGVN